MSKSLARIGNMGLAIHDELGTQVREGTLEDILCLSTARCLLYA